jgi:hypothetical protein
MKDKGGLPISVFQDFAVGGNNKYSLELLKTFELAWMNLDPFAFPG